MKKILILILLAFFIVGCQPDWNFENSNKIAIKHVNRLKEFKDYNGSDLKLNRYNPLNCDGCWNIVYEFNVNTDELPDYITRMRVHLFIENGKVKKEVVSKLTANLVSGNEIKVEEMFEDECEHDYECEMPTEYLVSSKCAYLMRCVNEKCAVVCESGSNQLKTEEAREEEEKFNELKSKVIDKLKDETGYPEYIENGFFKGDCEGCYLFWLKSSDLLFRVSSESWDSFTYSTYDGFMTKEDCIEKKGKVTFSNTCDEVIGNIEREIGIETCCKD
jgi:hypothetical protein